MSTSPVLETVPLGLHWPTLDPFLFCAHHDDEYPAGDESMAPAVPVDDRDLGMDFSGKDGWSMYHGDSVPGFPGHPHRGFETVTYVRNGLIDHSDSLGAAARFGRGDVQWVTAGSGIVHSEMFPLVHPDQPNPLELFQIWLNLPADDKMVDPYFTMLWDHDIPRAQVTDDQGNNTEVTVIAGRLGVVAAALPPPARGRPATTPTSPSGTSDSTWAPPGPFPPPSTRRSTGCSISSKATRPASPTPTSTATPGWC